MQFKCYSTAVQKHPIYCCTVLKFNSNAAQIHLKLCCKNWSSNPAAMVLKFNSNASVKNAAQMPLQRCSKASYALLQRCSYSTQTQLEFISNADATNAAQKHLIHCCNAAQLLKSISNAFFKLSIAGSPLQVDFFLKRHLFIPELRMNQYYICKIEQHTLISSDYKSGNKNNQENRLTY